MNNKTTKPQTTFTRRRFIKTVAIGTGYLAFGGLLAGCAPGEFLHGVASGDPLQDRAVIWTRVTPMAGEFSTQVGWIVSTDAGCRRVVGSGIETTDASRDFTIKLDVTGLRPGQTYYYQFITNGAKSPIGRLRTMPVGDVKQFSLAAISCSNYPAGYFHVYGEIAARTDIDAVLHLGDYIYEYGVGQYATEDAAAMGREPIPATETLTLDDYRKRYAQYRGDVDLQAVHRQHAFICVWDDHEIANDAWRDGAENHNEGEGDWNTRKAEAIQAYYEWMPIREPQDGDREHLYRSFQIGNLLDLYMLDTRVVGRDEQLAYANYIDSATGSFNAEQFVADVSNPNRTLMGFEQRAWLQQQMSQSRATWQVLGQQVLIGRMNIPAPLITGQTDVAEYSRLVQLAKTDPSALTAEQLAIVQAPYIPYNLDAWDGYAAEREVIFETARTLDKNLIVLAGDTHNAWANNLKTLDGTAVGVEFATSSVSSPGLEYYFPNQDPDALADAFEQFVTDLQYANLQHRGYLVVDFNEQQCQSHWNFIDTVKKRDYKTLPERAKTLTMLPGAKNRTLVDS